MFLIMFIPVSICTGLEIVFNICNSFNCLYNRQLFYCVVKSLQDENYKNENDEGDVNSLIHKTGTRRPSIITITS